MKKLLALLLLVGSVARADQITGTWMLDGETSTDGTLITPTIINNMMRGADIGTWQTGFGTGDAGSAEDTFPGTLAFTTIENDAHHALFTPFFDGTTTYDGSGTRGIKFAQNRAEAFRLLLDSTDTTYSLGFLFNFIGPNVNFSPRDVVYTTDAGGNFQVLQIYDQPSRPYFHVHGQGFGTGNPVNFDRNHWYWVTMKFVPAGQTFRIRFYDAENNYSLVGESSATATGGTGAFQYLWIGMFKYPGGSSQSLYFDNIIYDSSGAFPLGPGTGGNNPYWVSPTGAAAWSAASSATALSGTACASITTMNANVVAGNTVNFRTGAYNTQINPAGTGSGSISARVTLQNYNGENVVISNVLNDAFDMTGMDYYTISGINVTNCDRFMVMSGSDNNLITNCAWGLCKVYADGTWNNALRIRDSSTHNTFINSSFKECGWVYQGDDQSRVMMIGTDNSTTDLSRFNLFQNCVFARGGHDTVYVVASFNRFQNCHFYNDVWYPLAGPLYGNRNMMLNGVGSSASGWNVIDSCTFFRAAPPPDALGVSGFSIRSHHNFVRRSVFVDGADSGINLNRYNEHDGWTPQGLVSFNHVYNNTVVYNGINTGSTDTDRVAGITLLDDSDGSPAVGTNALKNNILWANARALGFEGVTSNLNIFAGNRLETSDPLFVDWSIGDLDPDNPAAHDFHLTSSSTSIDAGVFLTTITTSTGSGMSFTVADPGYFTDGEGIYAGDSIQVEGQASPRTVTDVNYTTGVITVNSSVSWTQGNGVALAFNSTAPDQGAFEFSGPTPGIVQFAASTYNVAETNGFVTNIVTRTGGSSGAIGVTFKTLGSTATSGVDFGGQTNTLSWADGNTANKEIVIAITNDVTVEDPETFTVTLSAPTGGASLGNPTVTTVTILDDETPLPPLMPALTWEVEAMQIVSPFISGGGLVSQSSETTDPTLGGSAQARFTIPTDGGYHIKMRVDAANASSDSIFIDVDAEPTSPTAIWDVLPLTTGVQERTVGWRGNGGPSTPETPIKSWNLTAGVHTLYIRGREASMELDYITVEADIPIPPPFKVQILGGGTGTKVSGNVVIQ